MLMKFRKHVIADTEIYKDYGRLRDNLDLPSNFDDLSPLLRTQALARASAVGHDCRTFLKAAGKLNIIRFAHGSLQSVASCVRSYVRFCAVLGRTPFPPAETTVRPWGTLFKAGRTYKNYMAHLKKACFLLEVDTRWGAPAVRTVAHGLENAQGRSFAFPNFLFPRDILTIRGHSPFFQLTYLSYLFPLVVPSEALMIRRAYADDPLTEFVPQPDKALMGIRRYKDHEMLILKFVFRKNIRGGCVLFRPCLCSERDHRARTLCPVHAIWPIIRDRTPVGNRISEGSPPLLRQQDN